MGRIRACVGPSARGKLRVPPIERSVSAKRCSRQVHLSFPREFLRVLQREVSDMDGRRLQALPSSGLAMMYYCGQGAGCHLR